MNGVLAVIVVGVLAWAGLDLAVIAFAAYAARQRAKRGITEPWWDQ